MEVTIGVQNLARELVVDTDLSAEAVATAVADALGGAPALELTDSRGRRVIIPTASLGYVEISSCAAPAQVRAIGHPVRTTILQLLHERAATVSELAEA
ncbi:DUF3107 family protein, partial [Cellulosimicrobium cellulans]